MRWFRMFAMNVSQIYDGDGELVELKIELEGAAWPAACSLTSAKKFF